MKGIRYRNEYNKGVVDFTERWKGYRKGRIYVVEDVLPGLRLIFL